MLIIQGLINGMSVWLLVLKLLPFIGLAGLVLRIVFGWDEIGPLWLLILLTLISPFWAYFWFLRRGRRRLF